jgi:hypothetical protein
LRKGGGGRTIQTVSLLAYSARRAAGALLVFLVVIWLLLFGVAHIGVSVRDPLEGPIPFFVYYFSQFQPELAHSWEWAAVEVAGGLLIVLGVGLVRARQACDDVAGGLRKGGGELRGARIDGYFPVTADGSLGYVSARIIRP